MHWLTHWAFKWNGLALGGHRVLCFRSSRSHPKCPCKWKYTKFLDFVIRGYFAVFLSWFSPCSLLFNFSSRLHTFKCERFCKSVASKSKAKTIPIHCRWLGAFFARNLHSIEHSELAFYCYADRKFFVHFIYGWVIFIWQATKTHHSVLCSVDIQ